MEKIKSRAFNQSTYLVRGRVAELIAADMRKVVFSRFGIQAEIEVGGFSDDEARQIKMTLFGSRQTIAEVVKYVNDNYDFEI